MTLPPGPTEERQSPKPLIQDSALNFFQRKRRGGIEGLGIEGPLTARQLIAICQMAGRTDMAREILQQAQAGSLDMERTIEMVWSELQRLNQIQNLMYGSALRKDDPKMQDIANVIADAIVRLLAIAQILLVPPAGDASLSYVNAALGEGEEANTKEALQERIWLVQKRIYLKDSIRKAKQSGVLSVRHLVAICQILDRFDLAQEIRQIVKGGGKEGIRQAFQLTMRGVDEHLLQFFESGIIPAILALSPTDPRLVEINRQITAAEAQKSVYRKES